MTNGGKRRPELDGVRGLAILLVLFGHAGANHGVGAFAATGVTLFFVLSGYLITGILLAEHERPRRIRLRHFYARRLTRLGPPLLLMLVVTGLVMRPGWAPWLSAATWSANYASLAGVDLIPYGHTWSLAVEEQFYLAWPLLLLVLLRSRRAITLAVALLVALLVWRFNRVAAGDLLYAYGALETAGSAVVAGCVVALVRLRLSAMWGWVGLGLMLAMTAGAVVAGGLAWMVLPLAATLPAAILVGSAGSLRWLTWRPLTFAGVVSYSVYLWHEPLSHLVSDGWSPQGVGVGAVVGLVAYFLVERPVMQLRARGRDETPRPHEEDGAHSLPSSFSRR